MELSNSCPTVALPLGVRPFGKFFSLTPETLRCRIFLDQLSRMSPTPEQVPGLIGVLSGTHQKQTACRHTRILVVVSKDYASYNHLCPNIPPSWRLRSLPRPPKRKLRVVRQFVYDHKHHKKKRDTVIVRYAPQQKAVDKLIHTSMADIAEQGR